MNNKLDKLRKKIDMLDRELLDILGRRYKAVREIGRIKKDFGIAPLDEKRWTSLLERQLSNAHNHKLSKGFVEKFFNIIHDYSLEIESEE